MGMERRCGLRGQGKRVTGRSERTASGEKWRRFLICDTPVLLGWSMCIGACSDHWMVTCFVRMAGEVARRLGKPSF